MHGKDHLILCSPLIVVGFLFRQVLCTVLRTISSKHVYIDYIGVVI